MKYRAEGHTYKAYHQKNGPHAELFVAKDNYVHGGSSFKLLKKVSGSKLKLIADLDIDGVIMSGKHSSNLGEIYKYFGGFKL